MHVADERGENLAVPGQRLGAHEANDVLGEVGVKLGLFLLVMAVGAVGAVGGRVLVDTIGAVSAVASHGGDVCVCVDEG